MQSYHQQVENVASFFLLLIPLNFLFEFLLTSISGTILNDIGDNRDLWLAIDISRSIVPQGFTKKHDIIILTLEGMCEFVHVCLGVL
jgi:hypothetical protein